MKKKITLPYFPRGIQFITPLIVGLGAYLLFRQHFVWGGFVLLTAIVVLTTRYVTVIDLDKKQYSDYLSLLGIPLDEEKDSFRNVDKIVITKSHHAHTARSQAGDRQVDWIDFTASVIFDGSKTLDLLTRNHVEDLLKGIRPFADFLQVSVEDRTTDVPYWVDMGKVGEQGTGEN